MSAEHIRESILLLLAQSGEMTAAEIYDKSDIAETKQALYAQINYLKKTGLIDSELGGSNEPVRYKLTKPLKEIEQSADETETETETATLPDEFVVETSTTHRFVWEILDKKLSFALVLRNGMWHLSARRVTPITSAMLREMADLIDGASV